MLPGEALAYTGFSRGRGDLFCRTYNVTLRANQVLSRCSSQNSCKLVAECSLCLARARESVCGKSRAVRVAPRNEIGRWGGRLGRLSGNRLLESCPFVRKQTQPMF